MVEVGRVELPSESTLTGPSPGADGYCGRPNPPRSPSGRIAVRPSGQVRVIMRGRVNSFPPHGRHINDAFPGLWPLRFRRLPLVRQQQRNFRRCSLIYNCPFLGCQAHPPADPASMPPSKPVHPRRRNTLPLDRRNISPRTYHSTLCRRSMLQSRDIFAARLKTGAASEAQRSCSFSGSG